MTEALHRLPRRHLLYATPLVVFGGLAVAFAWGLTRDPQVLPSALIGKPVPTFRKWLKALS